MIRDKESEIKYIISKSSGKIDENLAKKAVDILPSWRDIQNHKVYVFALVEDEYNIYWAGIDADEDKLKYIITENINKEILEYSLPMVSNGVFELLIKNNLNNKLLELTQDNNILYIKLTK